MSLEKIEAIRTKNNNTTVSRLFTGEGEESALAPIPNPIERFEQCFGEYPDLMGNFFRFLDNFCNEQILMELDFYSRRANPPSRFSKSISDPVTGLASATER